MLILPFCSFWFSKKLASFSLDLRKLARSAGEITVLEIEFTAWSSPIGESASIERERGNWKNTEDSNSRFRTSGDSIANPRLMERLWGKSEVEFALRKKIEVSNLCLQIGEIGLE